MLDILNSNWLLKMLEKSGNTPRARMLALFDILDDWLNAPRITLAVNRTNIAPVTCPNLLAYLTQQAILLTVEQPQLLANQVFLMALAAAREKTEHADSISLSQAKIAADALITAQINHQSAWLKPSIYAGSALILCLSVGLATHLWRAPNHLQLSTQLASSPRSTQLEVRKVKVASPEQTAALHSQIEQMRHGNCQLLEALQLPDSYKEIYFENIVMGRISTNPDDQKLVRDLLEKVRCNYTPMLMANSKG